MLPLATFSYRHEAELAFGYLDNAGIDAVLYVDDAGGADVGMSFSNPARILVRPEHYEKARELFESLGIPVLSEANPDD